MAIVLPKFSRRRSPAAGTDSSHPSISLSLCHADALYEAGAMISVGVRIGGIDPANIHSAECSILWRSEGKGDEDVGIHHFVRRQRQHFDTFLPPLDNGEIWRIEDRIECRLPPTPLSYRGHLITIRWCVRWRIRLEQGEDVVQEVPFHLVATDQIEQFRTPVQTDDGGER